MERHYVEFYNPLMPKENNIARWINLVNFDDCFRPELNIIEANPTSPLPLYETAKDAWEAVQHGESIENVYGALSPSMRQNPQEMLGLIALRPDAILQVDKSIMNQEFLNQAMSYQPLVFDVLPEKMQHNPQIVDSYREAIFNGGQKPHPVLDEVNELWFPEYTPSPACPPELLYTPQAVEKMFGEIMKNLDQHRLPPPYHSDLDAHTAAGTREKFIALAFSRFPEKREEFQKTAVSAYETNKEQVAQQACSLNGGHAQACVAALAYTYGFDIPRDEWERHSFAAYTQWAQEAVKQSPAEAAEAVYSIITSMDINPQQLKENMDLPQFWQDAGRQLYELERASTERDLTVDEQKNLAALKEGLDWGKFGKFITAHMEKGYPDKSLWEQMRQVGAAQNFDSQNFDDGPSGR